MKENFFSMGNWKSRGLLIAKVALEQKLNSGLISCINFCLVTSISVSCLSFCSYDVVLLVQFWF